MNSSSRAAAAVGAPSAPIAGRRARVNSMRNSSANSLPVTEIPLSSSFSPGPAQEQQQQPPGENAFGARGRSNSNDAKQVSSSLEDEMFQVGRSGSLTSFGGASGAAMHASSGSALFMGTSMRGRIASRAKQDPMMLVLSYVLENIQFIETGTCGVAKKVPAAFAAKVLEMRETEERLFPRFGRVRDRDGNKRWEREFKIELRLGNEPEGVWHLTHPHLEPPLVPEFPAEDPNWDGIYRSAVFAQMSIGPEFCRKIGRKMILNESVLFLDLSECSMGDEACIELCGCLARNATLQTLNISGNFLTGGCAEAIAGLIKSQRSVLRTLFAACNRLGDETAIAIAEALPRANTLEFLNLRGNNITDLGAHTLITMAQPHSNTSLTALWLQLNMVSDEAMETLNQLMISKCPLEILEALKPKKKKKGRRGTTAGVSASFGAAPAAASSSVRNNSSANGPPAGNDAPINAAAASSFRPETRN